MPTNLTNSLEILLLLPIKSKHKNWFYSYLWLAINMAGKYINYLSFKVIKHLQNQYWDTNFYDSLVSSTVNRLIDFQYFQKSCNKKIKKLVERNIC